MANISEDAVKGYSPSDIIKAGITSYLQQNKNISVKDLLTKKSRQNAGNQLRSTLKSTTLDTGQNLINALRKEEVSRRKKPSAIRKKKALDAALEKLKNRKASLKEGNVRADKLAQAVRSGITTGTVPSLKVKKLDKIIKKVRGIKESRVFKEGIGTMTDADIARTGATPEMQAKVRAKRDAKLKNQKPTTQKSSGETKQLPGQKGISGSDNNKSLKSGKDKKDTSSSSNKGGAIVKSKGSALTTRGTKNTEVKDKREPKPYSIKKKEKGKFKGPSKERIGNIAKGIHNAVKSAGSAVSQGYGQSSWN